MRMVADRDIDIPAVLAEVKAVFARYEAALLANDTEVLDQMFLTAPTTIRYGVAEVQHGNDELRAFRATQAPFERRLYDTVITTYGNDMAVASTLFQREDAPHQTGRQMQTWLRTSQGWRIVAAHVSVSLD